MAWKNEITQIVRVLINDFDETSYQYDGTKIETLIATAAQLLQRELDFDTIYTITVMPISISPDPTTISPRDDIFINMVSLKAACLVLGAEVKTLAAQSFKVQDASATIDVKGAYEAMKDLYDKYCDDLARAKTYYLAGNLNAIKAIITPTTVEHLSSNIYFG